MRPKTPKPSGRPRPGRTGRPERQPTIRRPAVRRRGGLPGGVKVAGVAGLAVVVLLAIFLVANRGGDGQGAAGRYAFQVGDPGPGTKAPPITLATTADATFDLATPAGQTTLLYFQEGLGCQPCWDQRSEEHTSELQSRENLVCRLLLEKKK